MKLQKVVYVYVDESGETSEVSVSGTIYEDESLDVMDIVRARAEQRLKAKEVSPVSRYIRNTILNGKFRQY